MNLVRNALTKEHFDLYVAECRRWLTTLQLGSWEVDFAIGEQGKDIREHAQSQVSWDLHSRMATFYIAKEATTDWTDELVRLLALHEVLHVVLAPLEGRARWRYVQPDEIEMATHEVVTMLVNYVRGQEGLQLGIVDGGSKDESR